MNNMYKKSIQQNVFMSSFRNEQAGVTLIESVIALLIFSLGALGLAALQLTSLSASGDSQQRSVVIWKAQEFIDRIKANESISDMYVTAIGNQDLASIGNASGAGVLNCTSFPKPADAAFCADTDSATSKNCDDSDAGKDQKVAYDIWDVFCNPDSGLAATGNNTGNTIGVTGLEVALRKNVFSVVGNSDHFLAFAWLSRETENNADVSNSSNFLTSLCGETAQNIPSNLDVYCIRFTP